MISKNVLSILLGVFLAGMAHTQSIERQVVGASGSELSSSGSSVIFTVGEAVINQLTNGTEMNQGFHQLDSHCRL